MVKAGSDKTEQALYQGEISQTLLGHANGDITTHYSAAELVELINAVESIVDRGIAQSPTQTVVKQRKEEVVGNLSETREREIKKG